MAVAAAWRSISSRGASRPPPWFSSRRALSSAPTGRFAALWGNGDFGRLGLGGLQSQWRPVVCHFSDEDPPVSLSCGGAHTLFLTESGRVYATGLNDFGQLGVTSPLGYAPVPVRVAGLPENVVQISAGYHHSSVVTDAERIVSSPTCVDSLHDINIKVVALGMEHSIAITDEGNVLSWGAGGSGRLGHGHRSSILGFSFCSSEHSPRLIKHFEGYKIKMIAAGMLHSACIDVPQKRPMLHRLLVVFKPSSLSLRFPVVGNILLLFQVLMCSHGDGEGLMEHFLKKVIHLEVNWGMGAMWTVLSPGCWNLAAISRRCVYLVDSIILAGYS